MEAHSCQSFTGVKLPIICYSDACLSNIYALKYALTTQQPDVKLHDALVHNVVIAKGLPGDSGLRPSIYCRRKRVNRLGPIPTNKSGSLKLEPSGAPSQKPMTPHLTSICQPLGSARPLVMGNVIRRLADHLQLRIHWAGVLLECLPSYGWPRQFSRSAVRRLPSGHQRQ